MTLSLLLLGGCAHALPVGAADTGPGFKVSSGVWVQFISRPVRVYCSGELLDVYANICSRAVDEWNRLLKLPRPLLELSFDPVETEIYVAGVPRLSHPGTKEPLYALTTFTADDIFGWVAFASIAFDMEIANDEPHRTMMHELGHALGLRHDDNDRMSLMYPYMANTPWHVTSEDIEHLRLLYGK